MIGDQLDRGKGGGGLSLAEGRHGARIADLSLLALSQAELGDLDGIQRFIQAFRLVHVAPGFD